MQQEHRRPGHKIAGILQAFMSLIYLFSACWLFFSEQALRILPGMYLPWVSGALLLYGVFRAWRSWTQLKSSRIKTFR